MTTTMEVLFAIFDLSFDFWPMIIIGAIQTRRNAFRAMLVTWVIWAVIRILLFFNPQPIETSFLIPDPLNTILFFVAGAGLFGFRYGIKRWQQRGFRNKTGRVNNVSDLHDLSSDEFEDMVVELYRVLGHKAQRVGSAAGDHGVDVVIQAGNGEKWIVQCKRWKKKSVGEPVVRDFYGAMQHEEATEGAIITASKFTRQAQEWAKGKPIHLYDGAEFLKVWHRAKAKS